MAMEVSTIKLTVNQVVLDAEALAKSLAIPFDGVVYAGIVAITKKEYAVGEVIENVQDRFRIIRLTPFTYKKLYDFGCNTGTTDQGAINRVLRFCLQNPDKVKAYYLEGINDPSVPKKISKSN